MIRRVVLTGSLLAASLQFCGCQRLEEAQPLKYAGRGAMPYETLAFKDAIPMEFGDLIGVTASDNYPTWTQAWFMREDRSIAIVWINARTGALIDRAMIIPRR